MKHILATTMLLVNTITAHTALAEAPACELNRPVMFAGLDWESNAFHTAVARKIIEVGYGCQTDELPGSTLPMLIANAITTT